MRGQEAAVESARLVEVCLRFGVPMSSPGSPRKRLAELGLTFAPGTLTLVTGPSGAGKSLLLAEIAKKYPTARLVNQVRFPLDVPVIDAVAPTRPVSEALGLLTACGLGEPTLWGRRFEQLAEGERFRARLARAIGLHRRDAALTRTHGLEGRATVHGLEARATVHGLEGHATLARQDAGATPLLCDEFGSLLHRRLARAVAFNLRKLVSRERLAVVVATSQCDLEQDLRPDRVVRLGGSCSVNGESKVGNARRQTYAGVAPSSGPVERELAAEPQNGDFGSRTRERVISFARRLRIERGSLRDYAAFSAMHYRHGGQLGFVDNVFVMREGAGGEALGVVVYGMPALELALRNGATGGRFARNAARLNREMRVLKRLVIHPDVRGCGLGHWLVARTLPEVGTAFVECLAAMGAVNPVFERAGMRRIGVCTASPARGRVLAQLRASGADPLAADFVAQVCRRPAVRRLVASAVSQWYRGITGEGEGRVARQTPTVLAHTFQQLAGSEPVHFLWARERQGWELIDGCCAEVGK